MRCNLNNLSNSRPNYDVDTRLPTDPGLPLHVSLVISNVGRRSPSSGKRKRPPFAPKFDSRNPASGGPGATDIVPI